MGLILDQTSQNSYTDSMKKTVSVYDFKSKLSEHLEFVEQGEDLVVTRNGKPIARVVPFVAERLPLGAFKDQFPGLEDADIVSIDWLEQFPDWRRSLYGDADDSA
jgi:prevent-host-death family protein